MESRRGADISLHGLSLCWCCFAWQKYVGVKWEHGLPWWWAPQQLHLTGTQRGSEHAAPLQEEALRQLWAVSYAQDGCSLLKAVTLFLYFSCSQMFATNKTAGRHLLCLWLKGQDQKDGCSKDGVAIALKHVPWCTSIQKPAACHGCYFFNIQVSETELYQERPVTLHVMCTANMPIAYKGLRGQIKALWQACWCLNVTLMDTAPCSLCDLLILYIRLLGFVPYLILGSQEQGPTRISKEIPVQKGIGIQQQLMHLIPADHQQVHTRKV